MPALDPEPSLEYALASSWQDRLKSLGFYYGYYGPGSKTDASRYLGSWLLRAEWDRNGELVEVSIHNPALVGSDIGCGPHTCLTRVPPWRVFRVMKRLLKLLDEGTNPDAAFSAAVHPIHDRT